MDQQDEEHQRHGQELRDRRERVGISQIELAKIAGVSRGTIRNAESGMGLQARTLANVLRALGCVPSVVHGIGIMPVLTPGTMRVIAKVLLNSYEIRNNTAYDNRPYPPLEEWHEELTDRFFKLMDSASTAADGSSYRSSHKGLMVPDTFSQFRDLLEHVLSVDDLREFDREMLRWFGRGYPYLVNQHETRDRVMVSVNNPKPLAEESPVLELSVNQSQVLFRAYRAALDATLPSAVRVGLLNYLSNRGHTPDADYVSEIRVMIAALSTLNFPDQEARDGVGQADQQ